MTYADRSLDVPLSKHVLFQSTDLDCAREQVARKFCRHKLEVIGERHLFRTRHHHFMGDMLSLNYIEYGADVTIDPGELKDFYLIQVPIAGFAKIRNGLRDIEADRTVGSILNPHWATRMRWMAGCRQILLQIKKSPFQAFANRVFERDLPGDVTFDPKIDLNTPGMGAWLRLVATMFAAVDHAAGHFGPTSLTWALNEQRLVDAFLQLQPSNVALFHEPRPREPLPRHLRRAREFIRAHADAPITLMDIATASGCSTRTLQLAFHSALGTTPLNALRDERLRRVRFDLLDASAGTTVADIALKWGFNHLGRFSADYRAAYGELPRDTVKSTARPA